MTSSLPSLTAMYVKAAMPTRTKTPTMSSSFVSCMGTGPPGLTGGDNFGPGPDIDELPPHAREYDRLQHLKDLPLDLRFFHYRLLPQGKGHVFKNVERVEQRRALEQHRKFLPHLVELARAQPGDIDLVHQHLATIRLQQPDHMLEQHTLAAAALADHRGDFSPGNLQVDSLQDRLPPERLFHPDEANHRLRPLLAFHHSACVVLTSRPRSQNSPKSGSRRRTAPPPRSWRFPVLRRSSSYCTLYTCRPRTRSRRS